MHPATLHGVGVITKLYFVIFAASKESMTLNLDQRSFRIIHFGRDRKPVSYFMQAVYSNFGYIFNRFGDIDGFIRTQTTV